MKRKNAQHVGCKFTVVDVQWDVMRKEVFGGKRDGSEQIRGKERMVRPGLQEQVNGKERHEQW
jgi:hypothetical protein